MPPETTDCSNKAITRRRWHSDLPKVYNWLEIAEKTNFSIKKEKLPFHCEVEKMDTLSVEMKNMAGGLSPFSLAA